jgi:hypothetical protein
MWEQRSSFLVPEPLCLVEIEDNNKLDSGFKNFDNFLQNKIATNDFGCLNQKKAFIGLIVRKNIK